MCIVVLLFTRCLHFSRSVYGKCIPCSCVFACLSVVLVPIIHVHCACLYKMIRQAHPVICKIIGIYTVLYSAGNKIPCNHPTPLQVREQEILENQALKDRAALSQSKGLQTRRLPKNYVSKVPVDYADRRRAQSYTALSTALSSEGTDGGSTPEISEEERKQRVSKRVIRSTIRTWIPTEINSLNGHNFRCPQDINFTIF